MKWNILNNQTNISIEERLIQNRQIKDKEYFFNPVFHKYLYDPFLFTDMQKAINRIKQAINKNEKIIIYGDYDVDGITSATILKKAFDAINYNNISVFLPHRVYDGYGLNKDIIKQFYHNGVKLIITVDCGISNIDEIEIANNYNIDTIITDHHNIGYKIPPAYAIIHPHFGYPFLHLAGVGVVYKLSHALLSQYLSDTELEKFLKWNLDIVAIGTVADIQILQDENRLFVKNGLLTLKKTKNIGLQSLIESSSVKYTDLDIYDISFIIAPKLNASGRMENPYIAFRLLNTNNAKEAQVLSKKLHLLNTQRQNILQKMLDEAKQQIDINNLPKLLILHKDNWHHGIIGLVSGKICDTFYRPVITFEKRQDIYIGSARSIPQYNIIEAISTYSNLLIKYGGHASAAGFSIHSHHFDKFCSLLYTHCNNTLLDIEPVLDIDCYICRDEINFNTFNILQKFHPFGEGNKIPTFAVYGIIKNINKIGTGKKHLQMIIDIDGLSIDAIWFNFDENKIKNINSKAEFAVQIIKDTWDNNTKLKLKIIDMR